MSTRFFDSVDWQRPWLRHLLPAASGILQASDWRQEINAAAAASGLRNHRDLPLRFVPQSDLPAGTAYEAFISATGGVPTRENLHDFFNALVWLTFPNIKRQLNALQAAQLAKAASSGANADATAHRGRLRDAATIFDENAALLVCRDAELLDALRAHRWHEAFVERRPAFDNTCEVWLFGHALMEKLVTPYKSITAHAWQVKADHAFFAMSVEEKRCWLDSEVTRQLSGGLSTSDFTPLPVLGVPGWWNAQDEAFYQDVAVFRPKRMA
ncbi:DUF3025 domain-containing protein [Noviherbaspirillum massiliense]|uniref:DUF3025 domain-containing protein n=1 Tax=Noviherbaspirillum massiliense TaxID=1465823 RepID=UPI000474676A|nr:DUF3025 domain-containing protein [Noviherbaspirillum massiliense]